MTDEGSFELEIKVAATPEEVWHAIATGPGVSAWLQPTQIEQHVGGRFAFDLDTQGQWNESGTVSEFDPPQRFSTTGVRWQRQGIGGETSEVVTLSTQWIVEARDDGSCTVRLIMSGFGAGEDWQDEVGGVRDGMVRALESLRQHLELGAVGRAVAGALIPVSDLDRSVTFYCDVLGLNGSATPSGYRLRGGAGTAIFLLPGTDYAGTAGWPLATFETTDLAGFVADLKRRGVTLLTDVPFPVDEHGVFSGDGIRTVWFTDPDGQVLTGFEVTG